MEHNELLEYLKELVANGNREEATASLARTNIRLNDEDLDYVFNGQA